MQTIDIVSLVNNNPITKLNGDYGSTIISKIKEKFNEYEEQLFVANFFTYLNYDQYKDFVVDMDLIWKWIGFSRKNECKNLLVNNFTENVDYKIEKPATASAVAGNIDENGKNLGGSGLNKENILLTIRCFKKMCLRAKTKKSDEIHEYYLKLEDVMNEVVSEQAQDLRIKLKNSIESKEQNLLTNFSNVPILYIGLAENDLVKTGYTDNAGNRLKDHKREIRSDFTFEYVYESVYNREIERRLYQNSELKKRRLSKVYPGRKEPQTELFRLDSKFTIHNIDKIIKEIKKEVESEESNKDKDAEINGLKLKILHLELETKNQDTEEINTNNIVEIQLNSMQDLDLKMKEIKKAVCYNFLVDFVVKEIEKNNGNINFSIILTSDEFYEKYVNFRVSNRYQDAIFNEQYEKNILTKSLKNVEGIKNTVKTIDGIQSRARSFTIDKIVQWICKNIQVPKRFRNMFRLFSKDTEFVEEYCEIADIYDFTYKTVYSFLVEFIIKYKNNTGEVIVKNTILTEEYLKYILRFGKKDTMTTVRKILFEIPGIKYTSRIKENNKLLKGICIKLKDTTNWIIETLNIPDKYRDKLLD